MRVAIGLLVCLIFAAGPVFAADETLIGNKWNDSNSVELPTGTDAHPGTPDDSGTVPTDGGGGAGGGGEGGGTEPGVSGGGGGSQSGGEVIINLGGSGSGSSGSSGVSGSQSTGASGSGSLFNNPGSSSGTVGGGNDLKQNILNILTSSGGLTFSSGSGSGGGESITLDGAKVRGSLRGQGVFRLTLRGWGGLDSTLSPEDTGLIAASTALKNSSIESAFIAASEFDIAYRSHGYLLAFVPLDFLVRIHVSPASPQGSRTTVRFPWYQFFIHKYVSKAALATLVDAAIKADSTNDQTDLLARQARLVTAVASALQARADAAEDSVDRVVH